MPLRYKLYKIIRAFKDGREDKANNRWYARVISSGTMDTDALADKCAYATTVTPADCRAVLKALGVVMADQLKEGYTIKLDQIGTFKLGLNVKGAESVEEFSVQGNIKGVHVNFYPEYTVDRSQGNRRVVAMTQGCKVKETPYNDIEKEYGLGGGGGEQKP